MQHNQKLCAYISDAFNDWKILPTPSFYRGLTFYKAWEVIHGANPTVSRTSSTTVPWADIWQLEDVNGNSILKSNVGFIKLTDKADKNNNGVRDGYERTGHLHMQDNPNAGAHR